MYKECFEVQRFMFENIVQYEAFKNIVVKWKYLNANIKAQIFQRVKSIRWYGTEIRTHMSEWQMLSQLKMGHENITTQIIIRPVHQYVPAYLFV